MTRTRTRQLPKTAPQATEDGTAPATSVYRCAECGDGTRLTAWTHVVAHGPVSADGVIERYDYDDDNDDLIEESIICEVHGEGSVEKFIDGQYSSAMVNGRYVSPTVELATALLGESDVKWDVQHRELHNLALRVSGRDWKLATPEDIARFEELVQARAQTEEALALPPTNSSRCPT
ncbi:hypothetical protein [Nonomuraea wenchangensis]|uniref:Uncharacterized protein n=1 Tax=Nonomuraea wenchangensis TaxID=568860 RepID=A0A1I0LU14_9ACTN|nr:hypothetical protein [Nonomuraea wenchangensis]SEU46508.1 hypothetical protein SAMN05421811_12759 [Nonomuraea wenchangensis]